MTEHADHFVAFDLADDNDGHVVGPVHELVVVAHLAMRRARAQILEYAAGLVAVAAVRIRIDETMHGALHHVLLLVLDGLHLRVDDAAVLGIAVDMVDLGDEARLVEQREQYVVQVDGQQLEEAALLGRRQRVRRVVLVGPGVGAGSFLFIHSSKKRTT